MGDRANVVMKSGDEQVCLYTHWEGSDLPLVVQMALRRGKDRWSDFQYLSRIVFCEMIQDDIMGKTGYGISQRVHDGESRVIVVNVDNQTVQVGKTDFVSFADFVNLESLSW